MVNSHRGTTQICIPFEIIVAGQTRVNFAGYHPAGEWYAPRRALRVEHRRSWQADVAAMVEFDMYRQEPQE